MVIELSMISLTSHCQPPLFKTVEEVGGTTAVHAKALEVFANEQAEALQKSVENTCLQMCELLSKAYEHKNTELVGALCSCWPKMRHFGGRSF